MDKIAASALRSAVSIQDVMSGGKRNWRMLLGGQDIGGAHATPVPGGLQLNLMRLEKPFQGMGLGKMLMGRIMQSMQPGQTLYGGSQVSPQAQAVMSSMSRRPGLWQSQPGLPGGAPQPGVRPVGNFQGLHYPAPTYNALQSTLPQGLTPYHNAFLRLPTPTPRAASSPGL